MISRRLCLAGFGSSLLLAGCSGAQGRRMIARDIVVTAYPIASLDMGSSETRFGDLTFLSGMELESSDPDFGGLSAIRVDPTGNTFLTQSDQGSWIQGNFTRTNGALTGVTHARLSPILGELGGPLADQGSWDTEAVAMIGKTAFVSVERRHKVFRFDISKGFETARGSALPVPKDILSLDENAGLEALGILPPASPFAGKLIAVAEKDANGADVLPGFIFADDDVKRFKIKRTNKFSATDMTFLPNGDLVLLERSQSVWTGLQSRMRRFALADIVPGAMLEGKVIFASQHFANIDNMEGIDMHQNAKGETILTLVSDNNFSILQRTLVLEFRVETA